MSTHPLVAAVATTLLTACMSATAVTPRADLLGTPVPPAAANRIVTLTPATGHVNVTGGDVVRFQMGGQEFAWSFDTSPLVQVFDLSQVAPAGALGHEVLVYVAPDPRYTIRADFNDSVPAGRGGQRAR
ncbi:CzcE family metal-binding protein [Massilia jejuensis]|uniref:CzcE family metal-binding protein n=1 Tax=Massilia jejuensis TaxID=648894 RepID=A0ABW0PNJ5_9BURK